jgi:hypothetical protein
MIKIEIETSDKSLLDDLRSENIPGLQLLRPSFTKDSIDWVPPVVETFKFIVYASTVIELNILSLWLCDRFVKKKPDKATINGTEVSKEPEKIIVIFKNYIQIAQNEERDKKDH